MAKRFTVALPILLAASTSFALPRPNSHVRAGANHHLGDDSFSVNGAIGDSAESPDEASRGEATDRVDVGR